MFTGLRWQLRAVKNLKSMWMSFLDFISEESEISLKRASFSFLTR